MKKFIYFIGLHIFFICCFIYKQTHNARILYQKQLYEKELTLLQSHEYELNATLYALQNTEKIQSYALNDLQMQPISLKKIKKILPEKVL